VIVEPAAETLRIARRQHAGPHQLGDTVVRDGTALLTVSLWWKGTIRAMGVSRSRMVTVLPRRTRVRCLERLFFRSAILTAFI
jgi:hypothetical protein